MRQIVWSIDVDPRLHCYSSGGLRTVEQPWPLDSRVTWVHETYLTEEDAVRRLLELGREGRDIYLGSDHE